MPGRIVAVLVAAGQEVVAGQGLIVVEAMKMENEMTAPRAGKIAALPARAGETVEAGAILVTLE
jgi:biotin carboxyl carrier protein